MLGDINIYFGKVVDIKDDQKIFRCKVKINGYTEKIEITDLPWYFSWNGISFLPEIDNVVPVIIFDKNFNTGFYSNKKVNLEGNEISDENYDNYLEIFKRSIDNKNVQLTYTKSEGIQFKNDVSQIQLLIDNINLICGNNKIEITENKINLGTNNLEPTLMGNKTVQQLKDIISHQQNTITKIFQIFLAINTASSGTPFTLPISTALAPLINSLQPQLITENTQLTAASNNLQSNKVSNE
jgi:hypothetical protein